MKKATMITAIILLVAVAAFLLTACTIAREYKFESVSVKSGGLTMEYKAGDSILGLAKINEDAATLTLNPNGTYVFSCDIPGATFSKSGTWKKKGKTITFDDSYKGTISGKTITVEYTEDDGGKATFVMKRA